MLYLQTRSAAILRNHSVCGIQTKNLVLILFRFFIYNACGLAILVLNSNLEQCIYLFAILLKETPLRSLNQLMPITLSTVLIKIDKNI